MKTIKLNDIKERVKRNSERNNDIIESYLDNVRSKGLKKGRVRPRDITEQKILDGFKRK